VSLTKFGKNVAVVNLLNRWCGTDCIRRLRLGRREFVFVHTNRGIASDLYASLIEERGFPTDQLLFNKCAFHALFRFSAEFMVSASSIVLYSMTIKYSIV
jgi:hypothetical protein